MTFGSSYTARVSPRTYAQLFRIVATAEAISWAGLLTGMYFKYLTDAGDLGVRIFGPIHGGIFVAYVLITFLVSRALGWGWRVRCRPSPHWRSRCGRNEVASL